MGYVQGNAGQQIRIARGPGELAGADSPPPPPPPAGGGGGGNSLSVEGLPLIKPPYGTITAINLDRGEIVWQVAHGDTPDNVRNHPALAGLNIPRTGSIGLIGVLTTK